MKKSKVLMLCFAIALSVPLLQSCKKNQSSEDKPVENVRTWEGVMEDQNNYKITVTLRTGDKDNSQWVSYYDVIFLKYNSSGTPFYEVIKTNENPLGLARFQNNRATINIVSANTEHMPHYFDRGSEIIADRNTTEANQMKLSYTINTNDGGVFQGNLTLTQK